MFSHPEIVASSLPETGSRRESVAASAEAQAVAIDTLLLQIRQDCLVQPLLYLDEIDVPFGGE